MNDNKGTEKLGVWATYIIVAVCAAVLIALAAKLITGVWGL